MKERASDARLLRRLRGLLRLAEASADADDAQADRWQYAVSVDVLRNHTGMTNSDLQWLANEAVAEHRTETTRTRAKNRSFLPDGAVHPSARACFVITPAGLRLVRKICDVCQLHGSVGNVPPHWDAATRTLSYCGSLAKALPQSATTQSTLLDACEAANWINPIRNPWADMPPGKRSSHLRRALHHLNSSQLDIQVQCAFGKHA